MSKIPTSIDIQYNYHTICVTPQAINADSLYSIDRSIVEVVLSIITWQSSKWFFANTYTIDGVSSISIGTLFVDLCKCICIDP